MEQSAFLGNLYRHSVRCHDRLLLADAAQCWPTKSRVRLHVATPALHIFLYHYHSDISVFILGTIHVD